jgi:hypothetical protein
MRLQKIGLITMCAAAMLAFSGCSFLSALGSAGSTANAAGQLVIEEGTAVVIQSGCKATATETLQQCYDENASKALVIAQVLEAATPQMALADLQAALNKEIASLGLAPAEAIPLQVFSQSIISYITPLVGTNAVLSASALAIVNQVGQWVAQVANSYSPTTTAKFRTLKKIH